MKSLHLSSEFTQGFWLIVIWLHHNYEVRSRIHSGSYLSARSVRENSRSCRLVNYFTMYIQPPTIFDVMNLQYYMWLNQQGFLATGTRESQLFLREPEYNLLSERLRLWPSITQFRAPVLSQFSFDPLTYLMVTN